MSRDLGIPLVATNDAHYLKQSDAKAQDALVCISTGKNVTDIERMRYIDSPTSPGIQDEMSALFPDLTDALENTYKIADSCDLSLELGKSFYPQVDLPKINSPTSFKRTCP